jgi:hypothetical protein
VRTAFTHSLGLWAVVAPAWVLIGAALSHKFALDFHHAFLPAAHSVWHGVSPYSDVGSRALAAGTAFIYPPLAAYLLVPFTVLPPLVAELLATALVVLTVPATLLVLGVRDWRCYAIAFLWWPTIIGIQTANVTLPMILGVALAWRYRDRMGGVLAVAFVVALKLFFWPLLVWLVATRRYRSAALSAVGAGLLVIVPWAGIGFAGLHAYPHMLARISHDEGPRSFSVAALFHTVVPSWGAASVLGAAAGLALLGVVFVLGRRGRDRDAFALALVAILVLTPLVEMHYFALLLVVVALYRRRLDIAWLLPLLMWGASANGPGGSTAQLLHVLVVAAATVVLAMSDWRPRALARVLQPSSA